MAVDLDILKHCMVQIGENPVSSYTSLHPSAVFCRQIIESVNKEVQERGWWFNKEKDIILGPETSGVVNLPQDTLDVVPKGTYRHLVRRESKFYDPYLHTDKINAEVTCDLTLLLSLDDLPPAAYNYIKHKSAFDVFAAKDGDARSIQAIKLEKDMNMSMYRLQQQDLREKRTNSNARHVTWYLQKYNYHGFSGNPIYPGGRG